MHILLLTDSLQTYPECIHSGYAHIISALLQEVSFSIIS